MKKSRKRTAWIKAIAIIGLVFSAFGIFGGLQDINMPVWIIEYREISRDIVNQHTESITKLNELKKINQKENNTNYIKHIDDLFAVPEWYNTFVITIGIIKVYLSFTLFLISISFLYLKENSIKYFYYYIGLSVVFRVIVLIITLQESSEYFIQESISSFYSIAFTILLLPFVKKAEKEFFNIEQEE